MGRGQWRFPCAIEPGSGFSTGAGELRPRARCGKAVLTVAKGLNPRGIARSPMSARTGCRAVDASGELPDLTGVIASPAGPVSLFMAWFLHALSLGPAPTAHAAGPKAVAESQS